MIIIIIIKNTIIVILSLSSRAADNVFIRRGSFTFIVEFNEFYNF